MGEMFGECKACRSMRLLSLIHDFELIGSHVASAFNSDLACGFGTFQVYKWPQLFTTVLSLCTVHGVLDS